MPHVSKSRGPDTTDLQWLCPSDHAVATNTFSTLQVVGLLSPWVGRLRMGDAWSVPTWMYAIRVDHVSVTRLWGSHLWSKRGPGSMVRPRMLRMRKYILKYGRHVRASLLYKMASADKAFEMNNFILSRQLLSWSTRHCVMLFGVFYG